PRGPPSARPRRPSGARARHVRHDPVTRSVRGSERRDLAHTEGAVGRGWLTRVVPRRSVRPRARPLDHHPTDDPLADAEALARRRSAESRLMFTALALLSLVVLAAGWVVGLETARLIGAIGALIAGVGAAPLQLSDRPNLVERVGVALMLGLALATLI